jgi:hypothetical protein
MAARALLERMMINSVSDHGSFKDSLKAYGDYVGLGVGTRDAIKAVLGVGDAAIHRAIKIDDPLLEDVMDHLEHIIHGMYILSGRTKAIEGATPPRLKGPKKESPRGGAGSG